MSGDSPNGNDEELPDLSKWIEVTSPHSDGGASDPSLATHAPTQETVESFENLESFSTELPSASAVAAATAGMKLEDPLQIPGGFAEDPPVYPGQSQTHSEVSSSPEAPASGSKLGEDPAHASIPGLPDELGPQGPIQEPTPQGLTEGSLPSSSDLGLGPFEELKDYSEKVSTMKASVPAAYPFSLLITGMLDASEQSRLLDLLSRENMGIREVDLEHQFASGQILIPRISEYAGVLLIQALRTAKAKLRFGPSDQIFATADTLATPSERAGTDPDSKAECSVVDLEHPAEKLPVTPNAEMKGFIPFIVIDTITASATLKTQAIEAEHSPEYQEILEALQRELKYKAHHRGAGAILNFTVQLVPLSMPTHFRLLVMGMAVKKGDPNAALASDPLESKNQFKDEFTPPGSSDGTPGDFGNDLGF